MSEILDVKTEEKKLVNKSDISGFIEKNTETLATKTELKAEEDKIVKLQTHNLSHFLGRNVFGDDYFQNMFVYGSAFSMLGLKGGKGTDYVIGWKLNGLYAFKLKPLYTAFLCNIKLSGYWIGIQFNKSVLIV